MTVGDNIYLFRSRYTGDILRYDPEADQSADEDEVLKVDRLQGSDTRWVWSDRFSLSERLQ